MYRFSISAFSFLKSLIQLIYLENSQLIINWKQHSLSNPGRTVCHFIESHECRETSITISSPRPQMYVLVKHLKMLVMLHFKYEFITLGWGVAKICLRTCNEQCANKTASVQTYVLLHGIAGQLWSLSWWQYHSVSAANVQFAHASQPVMTATLQHCSTDPVHACFEF